MPKILGSVPIVADLKHILFAGDGYSQDQL
jgi:hypothetical protein